MVDALLQQKLARRAVHRALRTHVLIRPEHCELCGKTQVHRGLDAHHYNGYERVNWLNVQWLCQSCHNAVHGGPLHAGNAHTESTKQQISTSLKRAYIEGRMRRPDLNGPRNPFYGKHHSEETREKLRKPKPRILCDVCGRSVVSSWFKRHRRSNCRVA